MLPATAGLIGAIGGAAISAGGALASGGQSAAATKQMYKKRYQWQVKDLKAAGLNPMLAYMNPAPLPNQPTFPNAGEAAVEGANKGATTAMSIRAAKTQLQNLDSSTYKNLMEGANAKANAALAEMNTQAVAAGIGPNTSMKYAELYNTMKQTEVGDMTIAQVRANIENLQASTAKERALITNLSEQLKVIQEQIGTVSAQGRLYGANARMQELTADQFQRLVDTVYALTKGKETIQTGEIAEARAKREIWETVLKFLKGDPSALKEFAGD